MCIAPMPMNSSTAMILINTIADVARALSLTPTTSSTVISPTRITAGMLKMP